MAKKNKKKFKNRLHEQIQTFQVNSPEINKPVALAEVKDKNQVTAKEETVFEKEAKKDLKWIGLTFGGIVLFLVLAIILDRETEMFIRISDWLYKILNIQ